MPQPYTYTVIARLSSFDGGSKQWSGEATIGIRADSSQGYNALRADVRRQAEAAMRRHGCVPIGELVLVRWEPTGSSR